MKIDTRRGCWADISGNKRPRSASEASVTASYASYMPALQKLRQAMVAKLAA
jgi:hypothetical protein